MRRHVGHKEVFFGFKGFFALVHGVHGTATDFDGNGDGEVVDAQREQFHEGTEGIVVHHLLVVHVVVADVFDGGGEPGTRREQLLHFDTDAHGHENHAVVGNHGVTAAEPDKRGHGTVVARFGGRIVVHAGEFRETGNREGEDQRHGGLQAIFRRCSFHCGRPPGLHSSSISSGTIPASSRWSTRGCFRTG